MSKEKNSKIKKQTKKAKTDKAAKKNGPDLKIVKSLTDKLLELLAVKSPKIKADYQDELVTVNIDSDDNGVLIGSHGQTISSLQLILSIMIYKKTGRWHKLLVNIGDYREQRAETLKKIAINSAQKVKFSGKPVILINLNPSERRIVHMELQELAEVETISEGEGKDRKLIIRPKSQLS
jgi:spoIIIJ-associated protein